MKAIKDCKWNVTIETFYDSDMLHCWKAETKSDIGLTTEDEVEPIKTLWGRVYKRRQQAIDNWKKFAQLNGITCDNQNF